jgi:fatty acid amide hydrolase
MGSAFSS